MGRFAPSFAFFPLQGWREGKKVSRFAGKDHMEAERLQLAREATAAWPAANQPHWTEVVGVIVSGTGALRPERLDCVGLRQMQLSGERRDRALDQQGEALKQPGEVLAELLRRTA